MGDQAIEPIPWKEQILSLLEGQKDMSMKLKKLRKQVFFALQLDDDSERGKRKEFKKAIQALEESDDLDLSEDGVVTMKGKRKRRHEKEKKKVSSKRQKVDAASPPTVDDNLASGQQMAQQEEKHEKVLLAEIHGEDSKKPCRGNPQGVTRLFVGNLPFAVDETALIEFLPETATHIRWITDKETGKFYGSAFVEMNSTQSAAEAVAMAGSQLMGRALKINFAAARPGDKWPPEKMVSAGGNNGAISGRQAGGSGVKAMREKPDNCTKLFIGNLSYEIDDDGITKFFANVDADVKAIRWLHHRDSGDFKGW